MDIIIAPVITEKSEYLKNNQNVYVFKVKNSANKTQIKNVIDKQFKPNTPGTRGMSALVNDEITKRTPEKNLLVNKSKTGGRNNQGKITVRHIGGGNRKKYRLIDFKRNKDGIKGNVASIEYDPNRSANIALVNYLDGEKRYIIAPKDLKVGMIIEASDTADIKAGNALPL